MQINTSHKQLVPTGFTIVELLIVVVIIAILAAITMVSYNGVTAAANTSAAKATANTLKKKIEAYANDVANNSAYPATLAALTGAASSATYAISSSAVALNTAALSTANPASKPSEVNFYKCGSTGSTTAPTSAATITNTTGAQIVTWNYSTKTAETTSTGQVSGNTGPSGTYPVACFISGS